MRKRRSTVYVQPGKDVTLYVPSDTPPEVIAYLNTLKEEGIFSQGVMDMIAEYVQQHGPSVQGGFGVDGAPRAEEPKPYTTYSSRGSAYEEFEPSWPESLVSRGTQETVESQGSQESTFADPVENVEMASTQKSAQAEVKVPLRQRLNLKEIFQQAQKNSGKLIDS